MSEQNLSYYLQILADTAESVRKLTDLDTQANKATRTRKLKVSVEDAEIAGMAAKTEAAMRRIGASSKEIEANLKQRLAGMAAAGREAAHNLGQLRKREAELAGPTPFARGWAKAEAAQRGESPDVDWDRNRRLIRSNEAWIKSQTASTQITQAQTKVAKEHVAETKKYGEETKKAAGRMSEWDRALSSLSSGHQKNAMALIASTAMGGGWVGGALGSMVGALGAALVMPLVWKIGDAILRAPEKIQENIDFKRYEALVGAGAGGGASGEAWKRRVSPMAWFFEHTYGASTEKPLDTVFKDVLGSYQRHGRQLTDQDLEASHGVGASLMATLLHAGGGLEKDPAQIAAAFKDLEFGDAKAQQAAMSLLMNRSYIRQPLTDQLAAQYGGGPYGKVLADAYIDRRLALYPGMGGFDVGDMAGYYRQAAMSPRVKGVIESQRGWTHWSPGQGYGRLALGDSELGLTDNERKYASLMSRLYANDRKDIGTLPWLKEQSALKTDYEEGRTGLGGTDPRLAISVRRQAQIDQAAKGFKNDWSDLPWLDEKKSQGAGPSRFQFTSFAGLAETMQQMWGGVPVMESAKSLASIEKSMATLPQDIANALASASVPTLSSFFQGDGLNKLPGARVEV